MSNESHLPDDVSSWPAAPDRLLGVDRNADSRALRRAYNSLVRVFKPDTHPDQFQRIRAAYELLRGAAEYREQAGQVQDDVYEAEWRTSDAGNAPGPSTSSGEEYVTQAGGERTGTLTKSDAAWELAKNGQFDQAYLQLHEIAGGENANEEDYLRLYWLLQVDGTIDPDCEPVTWLCKGMQKLGLNGRLHELYAAEIRNNPAESLSSRCRELLALPGDGYRRAHLLTARWEAAPASERFACIEADLQAFRDGLRLDHPQIWVQLVLVAMEHLLLLPGDEAATLFRRCRGEIEELDDLCSEIPHAFDQLDVLNELWQRPRHAIADGLPGGMRALCDTVCDTADPVARRRVQNELARWVEAPENALDELDTLRWADAPRFRNLFMLVSSLNPAAGDQPSDPILIERIVQLLKRNHPFSVSYDRVRGKFMSFCFDEWITYERFVTIAVDLVQRSGYQFPKKWELFTDDVALCCLIHGNMTLHAQLL